LAPIIVVLNSLPRVALAPLIILWCGVGITAKVVTAFTLVYFILLVNTLAGSKNVDKDISSICPPDGRNPPNPALESDPSLGHALDFRVAAYVGTQHYKRDVDRKRHEAGLLKAGLPA
jgi:hypothetical protein